MSYSEMIGSRGWPSFSNITLPHAGTEGVAIVLDDLGQLPDQRFGLFVCQVNSSHGPDIGA
jgi:hypothetical protein